VRQAIISNAAVMLKAFAAGSPLIKEEMKLLRLKILKASYLSGRYTLEDRIIKYFPSVLPIIQIFYGYCRCTGSTFLQMQVLSIFLMKRLEIFLNIPQNTMKV